MKFGEGVAVQESRGLQTHPRYNISTQEGHVQSKLDNGQTSGKRLIYCPPSGSTIR